MMRGRWVLAVAMAAITVGVARMGTGQSESPAGPIGFLPGSRASEAAAEEKALTVPTPEKARLWLHTLTEEPHVAGTPADHKTAIFVRDKLREWGWQAELAEYDVLLNYPTGVALETVRPTVQTLKVTEDPHAPDKDSASPAAFPAFHGYGVSGDVEGQVVYANYGRPEDFTALERLGIEVKDKIVLVRYGELFRGLKIKNAQQRGARGVLIYSDPLDDGYARGDVYPNGPFRPPSAIQRGSVQFLSLGPGDPSTPNGPSVKGAKRAEVDVRNGIPLKGGYVYSGQGLARNVSDDDVKAWEKATGLKRDDYYATIPSLPISYESAHPILAAMGGANVPSGWQGGVPLAYHMGPGPVEVHFKIEMDYKIRTIWNVIGTINGSVEPDRWVMVGNHRDAWVYGAVDPGSGTAATLEMCRALGQAVKNGWKPRRTLKYASWDAEEYGLVGSTEWAEDHADDLDKKAVMLLNVDSAVSGHELDLDGVPSLRDFVLEAAGTITDVRSGKTLRDAWTQKKRTAWASTAPIDLDHQLWNGSGTVSSSPGAAPAKFSPHMNALGSGSDYTVFLDHLGISAIDVGFQGRYGVYHSIYDDFYWMEKFCDPEFLTHATAAKLYTLLAMRAASAEIVPFRFVPYGDALREQVDDLRRMVERKARGAEPNAAKPPLVFEGLSSLIKAVKGFQDQASVLDKATETLTRKNGVDPSRLGRLNDALARVERAFLNPAGLPARPWFKHSIYAPGLTTGYASWPMPGVRQAIIDNDAEMLAAQLPVLVQRIDAATQALSAANEAAKAASGDRTQTK
jgi:N-acetylated-alpha-linked acidic dipeptidase